MTAPASVLTLLQITDLHLRAPQGATLMGVDTWHSADAVLSRALAERRPDALLVTGDVAHDPLPDVYEGCRRWLDGRYDGPRLVLPGNHDVLSVMGALAQPAVLELGRWTVVGLDSHVDDEPSAEVDEAELATLRRRCADAQGAHILLATHHPPVVVGSPWLDRDRIQNGSELLEWLSEHTTVRAMVFGHAHQELASAHRQILLFGTPSTCIQFEPHTERFSVDEQKPGYRWLELGVDGTVRSHVQRLGDYPLTIDRSQYKPA
ncbi:MAG: metallophosphoesterase [Pseudomonadales bacterium]